jgi:hypothetical protein
VPKDAKAKARADVKRAQLDYERDVDAARGARRKSFARAQRLGFRYGYRRGSRLAPLPSWEGCLLGLHEMMSEDAKFALGL